MLLSCHLYIIIHARLAAWSQDCWCFILSTNKLLLQYGLGNYGAESLLEMIALHLDATTGDQNIWRELASCFLKVAHCEEDRLSVHLNGREDGQNQQSSVCYKNIPKMFISGKTAKIWKLRYRWWMRRHFSHLILQSEILSGMLVHAQS